jgi:hypothetical protein
MTISLPPDADSEIEREHREARAALEAARQRCDRAMAETEKVRDMFPLRVLLGEAEVQVTPPQPVPIELDAALSHYTRCLKALATDDSAAARERCANALAEYDRVCAATKPG